MKRGLLRTETAVAHLDQVYFYLFQRLLLSENFVHHA